MSKMSISVSGRVKNFKLPKNRPLVPLYEAIVNGIHAIEERSKIDKNLKGRITIEVIREPILDIDESIPSVLSFVVHDNGIGFNEKNMKSFLESDSTYKESIGGKGVGRFSWLKAFSSVHIVSFFKDPSSLINKREFDFNLNMNEIDDSLTIEGDTENIGTVICLNNYFKEYQNEVEKKTDTIITRIIEHCLIYLLSDSCPEIILKDFNHIYNINSHFKEIFRQDTNEIKFTIKDKDFTLLNVQIKDKAFKGNRLYLCANNRLVNSKDMTKLIPNLDTDIFDQKGFWYLGVLTSEYLDTNVDMNRLSFDIPEKEPNLIQNVTLENIINESVNIISQHFEDYFKEVETKKIERLNEYTSSKAPQYKYLIESMKDEISLLKPNLSDDKLDDALYGLKKKFEKETKKRQERLINEVKNQVISTEEYKEKFEKQVQRVSKANYAALAEYIIHRKAILDLFNLGLNLENGKYNKEKYLHDLIFPTRHSIDNLPYESHNLWLIDEKLAFSSYLTSDVPFNNDNKEERPDILVLDSPVVVSEDKNSGNSFSSITIFELKRPMRDDYKDGDNPYHQLLNYAYKIKEGRALDKNGRLINVNDNTQLYLYAICDITPTLKKIMVTNGLKPTPDQRGYFIYNDPMNAYIEILSYDKILNDSKKEIAFYSKN